MRFFTAVFAAAASFAAAFAQPSVPTGGALNSASYAYVGLPNSGIAQGSIFVVFGTNIGPATLQKVQAFPLQKTLGGTSIQVTVNGTTVDALPLYTSSTQVAAILPSSAPAGSGTMTLTYNSSAAPPIDVQVVANSLGIYTLNQKGSGPGIITDANYQVFSLTSSAQPGQTIILWATGLGPVSGDEAAKPLPGDMPSVPLKVYVGNQEATVTYRGRSGCCAGLDQIVFVVPSGVQGCRVPVALQIGSTVSNFVSMPIAPNGAACSDPVSNAPALDMVSLQTKGTVSMGMLNLSRSTSTMTLPIIGTQTTTTDTGSGMFEKYDFTTFNELQNPLNINTFGACSVFTFRGQTAGIVDPLKPTPLDAGPQITVTGPGGGTKQLQQDTTDKGMYSATLGSNQQGGQLYLTAGNYTVTGPGGADVGPFSPTLTFATPLTWTNADITNVVRSAGQQITWTGGDPNGTVSISGISMQIGTAPDGSDTVGAIFVCTAKVSDAQFNIPAAVLLSLPSSTSEVGGISVPTGSLSVGSGTLGSFTATGIDYGIVSSSVSTSKSVNYQ
jgi:uncharacterized protein (TIGR03437 family)